MLSNSDSKHGQKAYWCVVSGSDLWLVDGQLPLATSNELNLVAEKAQQIGSYNNHPVMWLNEADVEQSLEMHSLRECLHFPELLFLLMSKAIQYGHMTQTMRFCPQCGGRNHLNHNQLAMQCGECRTLHYPRIFPCIIVAVRKQQHILLAQHPRHRSGMYTVIAGFVEVGETLEQCVAREVKEETGIEVTNIRYFGSQPWAFPSSMMMAFLADYHAGELKPDYSELADAKWFTSDNLPPVAPTGTIARALIEQTLLNMRSDS
ncbi:NADH pyrophosphatase [Vibrio vulnificus]|uniref:NAD(+) diphosphatase n=1 Tax=Vibrio vulnificus TaxID=672 RepID=UPI0009B5DFC2|nr:NAD(+) diphosphatase [Vibrio vulnificus]OQK61202.1 NADH pyrophosphatase [Vibrio vulnificus]OQK63976.1 NADH pyrophosphatase [Vibrio vulnificus]POF54306.1 NAD(+) diphosphatase [Vibrio vulnificus]